MERLVQWYRQAPDDAPPEVLSAWLHHRFTYIHPFQDGNGRVARALASLVFLKAGLFPLVIRERDHEEYICALGEADAGDLAPLAALFARRQRDSILRAIGIEQQVRREGDPEQIMEAAFRLLRGKSAALAETQREVYPIAERLLDVSVLRMSEIQGELGSELAEIDSGYSASVDSEKMDAERSYYYWGQIVQIAKEFDYYANPEGKKAWGSLKIRTEGAFELVVSLHSYGRQFNGIMVASAFSAQRVFLEGGGTEPINTAPAMTDLFQFNYAERRESIERRFKDWLESAIAIALGEWYRTLDA